MPAIVQKHGARSTVEQRADSHTPKILAAADAAVVANQPSALDSTTNPGSRSESSTEGSPTERVPTRSALPPSDGLDAEGLRSFRLALAREAGRYKRYPRQAIEAGWEGTAEVQVTLRTGGVTEAVRLARSSGHAALDEAALAMLGQALPATPVPASLRERAFAVNLPVLFELPQ